MTNEACVPIDAVPICVDYNDLRQSDPLKKHDLPTALKTAFGPDGLGILIVKNVPNFPQLRREMLPLAKSFATLPDDVKQRYEDPSSSYNVGWSCGKEVLQDGTPDTFKGSYYANPLCDNPPSDPRLESFPQYQRPNLWPKEELPELEGAFKALGSLIFDVGMLLLAQCEQYLASSGVEPGALQQALTDSHSNKGRLLCYLPPPPSQSNESSQQRQWCGWHKDHGCLTGLTSAMYLRQESSNDNAQNEIDCPDPAAGLQIEDRANKVFCVKIPRDCIAFQVGEALQVLSGGALQATPHCVVQPRPKFCTDIYRNTFALFMQPNPSYLLAPGLSFGDFSAKKFKEYYKEQEMA